MRIHLLFILFLISQIVMPVCIKAQEVTVQRSTISENYKGKPYYIHFVGKGETLSAISKAYNVSIDEITVQNPLVEKGLKEDMVLRIPQRAESEIKVAEKPVFEKPVELAKSTELQKTPSVQPVEQGFIEYQVKKQETLYGISKQYNITVDDILAINPNFEGLKEGMKLKIPTKKPDVKPAKSEISPKKVVKTESNPDEIIVKTGETLYSIGKLFNITVDDLIDWNPELSNGLKAGMVLKLRKPDSTLESKSDSSEKLLENSKPALPSSCFDSGNLNKTYKIALLLPFLLDEASDVLEGPVEKAPSAYENFNYIQFYEGFMLAVDSLEKLGLHAQIQVLDAERLNDTLIIRQTLRKPGMDKMNLMIGPLYASSFSIAARFAKKNEIGIVNPLSRRENIINDNPFVIKSQVSESGISSGLSSFIMKKYPNSNVIVVRSDAKEMKSQVDNFNATIKQYIADGSYTGTIEQTVFSTDLITGVSKKLKSGKNIVILFSNARAVIPNFVSLLNPYSKSNDIILIGMDGWDELNLETEFLVNLNFHQVNSDYIDYENEEVQQFIARFRSKYGALPQSSKYAFLGYDIGWYYLTSLMWFGRSYMTCIPDYQGKGLQYNFKFSGNSNGNGLQNQDVNILKLSDYKMVKVE